MNIKKISALILSFVITITLSTNLVISAENNNWYSYRGDNTNNAVVDYKIPTKADDAVLYWSSKVGDGYDNSAIGSPILVNDFIIFCAETKIYKMDKNTGEILQSEDMAERSNYNIISPTYDNGVVYVGLANGTIQAFDFETLQSLWIYKDSLGGQANSPIVCNDGYIYTGFWNSETTNANYVCLSTKDEDTNKSNETKNAEWTYTQKGGFYWSGAYSKNNYVVVGTSDGERGYNSKTSNLISFNAKSGKIIDKIENLNGDICSSIAYDNETNNCYFTSKGGSFYSFNISEVGEITDLKELKLHNCISETTMSTSTPVVHNHRAYVGVSGTSQFTQYSGHGIAVIDIDDWKVAYTAQTKGYPQVSGILTTAYENTDDYSYVYFIDNYTPGQLRVLKDKQGMVSAETTVTESYVSMGKVENVSGCVPVLFTPSGAEAHYAVSSPIVDSDGTIYFKNDSSHMMAVGSKIESIEITKQPNKVVYTEGETFNSDGMVVTAKLKNGQTKDITKYITYTNKKLSTLDSDIAIRYNHLRYGDIFNANGGNEINIEAEIPEVYLDIAVISTNDFNSVDTVINAINNIGEVTLESGKSIKKAQLLYENLTTELKELVNNYDVLESAIIEYDTIKSVYDKIDLIGTVTLESGNLIENARKDYDNLTDEQKLKISNYNVLENAESEFMKIKNENTTEMLTEAVTNSTNSTNATEKSTNQTFTENTTNSSNSVNQQTGVVNTGTSKKCVVLITLCALSMSVICFKVIRKRKV